LPIEEEKFGSGHCLCAQCYDAWNFAKKENCPDCLCPSHLCLCAGKKTALKKYKVPKLLTYSPNIANTQNRMIYAMKKINDKRICEFVAGELAVSLLRYCKDEGIIPCECVFTYVPRRKRAIGEFGFDQGYRLAKNLCRICEGDFRSLFVRRGGKEQKNLGKGQRKSNAIQSIRLHPKAAEKIKGKKIVLVDDLFTTGETLAGAITLLKRAGAVEVYLCCVARTYEK